MVKRVHDKVLGEGGDWYAARRILARTLYKEMKAEGLNSQQILEFTNELLGLVQDDFTGEHPQI